MHEGRLDGVQHARAWTLVVGALALHVIDEALTDFLDFYNLLVLSLRTRWSWFPMPLFDFGPWLGGLIVVIVVLAVLTPAVRRAAPGTRLAAWILAALMFLNGLGHLAGSLYWNEWLPSATSAPLLPASSVYLGWCTRARGRASGRPDLAV